MMRRKRLAASVLGAAAIAGTGLVGATTATAAPAAAPHLGVLGDDIWIGDLNPACNGTVHVGLTSDPATPGQVAVSFTPSGMHGDCHTSININWFDTVVPFAHQIAVPLRTGPGPQPTTTTVIRTGQGLNLMSFTVYGLAKGVSEYVIVP